jgi:hypothetical protein
MAVVPFTASDVPNKPELPAVGSLIVCAADHVEPFSVKTYAGDAGSVGVLELAKSTLPYADRAVPNPSGDDRVGGTSVVGADQVVPAWVYA